MNQKIAIVTGGTSGLGYATARKFCEAGYRCYLVGRNAEKTHKSCSEMGPNARPVVLDLTHLDQIPGAIAAIAEEAGGIDVLVNNAGINMKKGFLEVTDAEFQAIIHTNLQSVFSISREVARVMQGREGCSIVNISSMAAQYGLPYVIAYSASKTAIEGMTRAMAVELAPMNIRTNGIGPGYFNGGIVVPMNDGGGASLGHDQNTSFVTQTLVGRVDLTSQVSRQHLLKGGVEFKRHDLFLDDFEGGVNGWTATGLWHQAADSPCAVPGPGYTSPVTSWYYGQDSSCDYVTGGNPNSGTLTSPAIAGITNSTRVEFDLWRKVENFGDSVGVDVLTVQVSDDGFTNHVETVLQLDGTVANFSWTTFTFSLAGYSGGSAEVRRINCCRIFFQPRSR